MNRKLVVRLGGLAAAAAAFVGASAFIAPRVEPVVIYNPTPSVPKGFYLRTDAELAPGVLVRADVPARAVAYLTTRGYEGEGSFLKPIAAIAGDHVCAKGAQIMVNGTLRAERDSADASGRALPSWSGCRTLRAGEAFLLAPPRKSFDSRYYGPVSTDTLKPVRPLWTF